MILLYKHYIRLRTDKAIIKSFSSAHREPIDGDILIEENEDRHYNLYLFDSERVYRLKYVSKKIVDRTEQEKSVDKAIIDEANEKESLIQNKIRSMAIEKLEIDGVLSDGKIVK